MTALEIKGIHYVINYIREEQFAHVTKFTKTHAQEISDDLSDMDIGLSASTIMRLMNFHRVPKRPSYDTLDHITKWCFDSRYFNFNDFLLREKDNIEEEIHITSDDIEDILKKMNANKLPATQGKSIQEVNLGGSIMTIDLSDVFVTKVLSSIKPIVGDLLSRKFEEETKLPSFHYDQRINTRLAIKETLRQKNIDTIVTKALRFTKAENPSHEDVDLDWMSHFFDSAQDTSNEDMQYIWAKILANEVDEPNSFSRRTINTIKIIDPEEAQLFTLLCNCLWELHPEDTMFDRVLFKNSTNEGKFSDASWGFNEESLKHLVDIGLIHETYIILEKGIESEVMYRGNKHILCTDNTAVEVEVVRLSNIGSEIFDVVMTEPNMEYYNYTLNFFKQEKLLKNSP